MPRESARGKKAEAKPAAVAAAAADKAKAPAAADGDAPVVHKFVPPDGGALRLIADSTKFSGDEISQMLPRFARLPVDEQSRAAVEHVLAIPETAMYPMLPRLLAMKNTDRSGLISFGEYVQAVGMLSGRDKMSEKVRSAFQLYNFAGQDRIGAPGMFNIFKLLTRRQHNDEALQQIVESFLERYPEGITQEDFFQMFAVCDCAKLTFNDGVAARGAAAAAAAFEKRGGEEKRRASIPGGGGDAAAGTAAAAAPGGKRSSVRRK
jgi:serine/threonine-protein phosphatase 2B regulatory subunit